MTNQYLISNMVWKDGSVHSPADLSNIGPDGRYALHPLASPQAGHTAGAFALQPLLLALQLHVSAGYRFNTCMLSAYRSVLCLTSSSRVNAVQCTAGGILWEIYNYVPRGIQWEHGIAVCRSIPTAKLIECKAHKCVLDITRLVV